VKTTIAAAAWMVLLFAGHLLADSDVIWWEGEKPNETNFPAASWFSPKGPAETGKLSEGAWLSASGNRTGDALFATYDVEVPEAGDYNFWVRKFWKHGPFRWRFATGAWRTCGRDCALADSVSLRLHVGANWVPLGQVTLAAGTQTLRIELLARAGESAGSGFDCFVLSRRPFVPRGKLKPGQTYGGAPDGWFAFEPGPDPFAEAALDLRSLNHTVAGEKGFLRSEGDRFVFQREPTRAVTFWAVNGGPTAAKDLDLYFARHMAKLGVNMVRIHGAVYDRQAADPATVDTKRLDRIHHFVAACKKEGIYVVLSFYFPLWFEVKPAYGIPGYANLKNKKAFTLLFFHPRMQEIYKSWATGLLRTRNPYTGLPLAADPAVGIVEIINEDNYFFWTTSPYENISAECTHMLEARYGRWLAAKYGSVAKALAAWGKGHVKGDDPAAGRAGLYSPWSYTPAGQRQANPKRIRDQARFLTEDLRAFYETMRGWFRTQIGLKCPLVATNWKTADERILGALDKYTNSACETLDRHGYFGSSHKGDGASYSLRNGHTYTDACMLLAPERALVTELAYTGHTHTVSEYNLPMPNRFRADGPVVAAAYGALGGTDAYFHFATSSAAWEDTHAKFSIHTPVWMGQSPACALIFRRGYVKPGPVVVHEAARLADLFDLKGTAIEQPQNFDELRKADIPPGATAEVQRLGAIDPLAYFVGRVTRTVARDPGKSVVQNLSPFIDRASKTVKSMTGQLLWDYGRGLVTINAPAAQGATGFLAKAGPVELADIAVSSANEYGSVLVVSMDSRPLATSARILVQVMTEDTNCGWTTRDSGGTKTITDLGGPPIIVRNVEGTVTIKRPDAASLKVTALDANGYKRQEVPGGAAAIRLLPDCLYYVVTK